LSVFPTGTVPVGPCPLGAYGCIPAGATGTGTGTGIGSSPSSTSAPYSYPNATSALPPPGSTGAASNSISGLPTAIFPTGTRPHFGPGPVIFPYGRPTKATGLHGYGPAPVESDTTSSVKAPNLVGKPLTVESVIGGGGYGSFPTSSSAGPSESAISGSGCMPAVTVTKSFTATVTVTVASGPGSGLPVSAAPFSSAPFPVPGNITIGGYTTGATGTGTGLPIGTGTGLHVLPSIKTASATLVPYT